MERLLSVDDLVGLTGWRPFTIYKKAAAGEIPGRIKLGKNSLRFRESAIRRWLSGQRGSSKKGGRANEKERDSKDYPR